jgi:hypothetical protein
MFAGRQFGYPAQGRSGWDALLKSRRELVGMLQGGSRGAISCDEIPKTT